MIPSLTSSLASDRSPKPAQSHALSDPTGFGSRASSLASDRSPQHLHARSNHLLAPMRFQVSPPRWHQTGRRSPQGSCRRCTGCWAPRSTRCSRPCCSRSWRSGWSGPCPGADPPRRTECSSWSRSRSASPACPGAGTGARSSRGCSFSVHEAVSWVSQLAATGLTWLLASGQRHRVAPGPVRK